MTELLGDRVEVVRAETRSLPVPQFDTPEAFREFFKTNYGPTIAVYRALGDDSERVAALDEALADLGRRFDHGSGSTELDWEYLLLVARRQLTVAATRAGHSTNVGCGKLMPSADGSGLRTAGQHDWPAVYASLAAADAEDPLPPADLERWAVAAHVVGADGQVLTLRERAYHDYLRRGQELAAARCAFWIGFHLGDRGELAQAAGWRSQLHRLLDQRQDDISRSLLGTVDAYFLWQGGDAVAALAVYDEAAGASRRVHDEDLLVLNGLGRGLCFAELGRVDDAVAALDEVMVQALTERVAPQVAGLAYCSVIGASMARLDLRRAAEWTRALGSWCDAQQGLVPYRGSCQVYRAEILQLRGSWREAITKPAKWPGCRSVRGRPPEPLTTGLPNLTGYAAAFRQRRPPTPPRPRTARRYNPAWPFFVWPRASPTWPRRDWIALSPSPTGRRAGPRCWQR